MKFKRSFSVILGVALCLSLMPMGAMASEEPAEETEQTAVAEEPEKELDESGGDFFQVEETETGDGAAEAELLTEIEQASTWDGSSSGTCGEI